MKTYRGFLLDADNTLFNYDRAETEALDATLAVAAPQVPREKARASYRAINAGYWKRFEQGAVSLADLKVGRFADMLKDLHLGGDAASLSDGYLARLSQKAYFLPHARKVVRALSRRAVLCLITNGISMVQRGRLARSGIAECFAAILISEELGVAKPDTRFFQAACDALHLPPSELLCVGDTPAADMRGAQAAGIDACWYAPSGAPWPLGDAAPHYIIRSLKELLKFAPL
ncbi:MAG: YjjG family noncanonical pyrimidine nucleotidase [Spirochaetia bacterium]